MKKNILYIGSILIVFVLACSVLFNFNKKKDEKKEYTDVTLAEVTHSIFYAPMYAAIEKGYFKEEGLEIDLVNAQGADKTMAALISGDADIGFAGSETTIYVYNGGEKDYLKTFAQLTQKDGSFIVSRKKIDSFTLDDLKGKDVIGGRAGGMPEMTFEWALKEHNIDPKKDVNIDTSIAFAAMSSAFIGGQGDFVTLFDDNVIKRKLAS